MNIKDLIDEAYFLVFWPESQSYMDKEWFQQEAILSEESSYFIPVKYILNEETK